MTGIFQTGVKVKIDEAKELIIQKKDVIDGMVWEEYEPQKIKCMSEIANLSDCLTRIHDRLFIPLNIINDNRLYKDDFKLKERICLWMGQYDISLYHFDRKNVGHSHIYERWMIWDRTVDEEIEYLLHNARSTAL